MTKIYGCSDDLIEVDGDVSEEFSAYSSNDEAKYIVACSDGTLLQATYDGCWRFAVIVKGSLPFERIDAEDDDRPGQRPTGEPWYSDVITFPDGLTWVSLGTQSATKKRRRSTR